MQLLEFVVAHEVAHQWWNAVVGSNSKKYPFIDEAMANYSAILYFEHHYGRAAAEQQMALQMKVNYQMHRLMGGEDKPVVLPASSYQGPMEYAAIIYGKGALFYDHLRTLMGDAAFLAATKSYYDKFWFRIAGPDDFKLIAQKKAPGKAKAIELLFQRWMNGLHGDQDIGPGTLDGVMKTVLSTNQDIPAGNLDELLKELDQILKQE
jgi:aminopeptidase N